MLKLEERFNKYYQKLEESTLKELSEYKNAIEKCSPENIAYKNNYDRLDAINNIISELKSKLEYDNSYSITYERAQSMKRSIENAMNKAKADRKYATKRRRTGQALIKQIDPNKNLYYFTDSFVKLLDIYQQDTIKATLEDSGESPDKNFISLTLSESNHPTRKPYDWNAGFILSPAEVINTLYTEPAFLETALHLNFKWLDKNKNVLIQSIGQYKIKYSIANTDLSANNIDTDVYYIRFLNCGRVPVEKKYYDEVVKLGESQNVNDDKITQCTKHDIPDQYFSYNESAQYKRCPGMKFSNLSIELQNWIMEYSVFNEKEVRIRQITSLGPIKHMVKGIICNESLKALFEGDCASISLLEYESADAFKNDYGFYFDLIFKNKSNEEWQAFAKLHDLICIDHENNWHAEYYPLNKTWDENLDQAEIAKPKI